MFIVYSGRDRSELQRVPWFCLSRRHNNGAGGLKLPKNGHFLTKKINIYTATFVLTITLH